MTCRHKNEPAAVTSQRQNIKQGISYLRRKKYALELDSKQFRIEIRSDGIHTPPKT
jgi:hypothetical protein